MKPFCQAVSRAAFTLLELVVVVSVILVLALIAYPATQYVLQGSRATACTGNLRQLAVGLGLFLADNNQHMPELRAARAQLSDEVPVIDNTLDRYLSDKRVFACPGDKARLWQTSGTSYYWNVALNGQSLASLNFLHVVEDHSRIPVLSDKEAFHPYTENKVNLLYADGHATKEAKFFTGN